jgi:DNA-binding MarR family transcriptional regulator
MTKTAVELIADNLMSIYPQLYKTLSRPMRTKTTVTPGGLFVMGSLKRNGMLSMSEIGKQLSIPKPHVTVIIDKLIDEGYVTRENDPADRRIIKIRLTQKGLKDFEEIKQAISESLKEKISSLPAEELQLLKDSSENVKNILISVLSKED